MGGEAVSPPIPDVGAPTVCPYQAPRVRLGGPARLGKGFRKPLGGTRWSAAPAPLVGWSSRVVSWEGLAFRRSLERFW